MLVNVKSYILVSAAVNQEVNYLITSLENSSQTTICGKKLVSGFINKIPIKVIVTGPCIVNAVQSVTAVIENIKPDLIIQTGCGGAFYEKGLKLGDICIASEEIDAQLGIESERDDFFIRELPFFLYKKGKEKVRAIYPADLDLSCAAVEILNKKFSDDTTIMRGGFLTVSTITATNRRAKQLFDFFNCPCIENMEGAAAAYTAMLYDIPFLEVRCVSNLVGKRDIDKWDLKKAFEKGNIAVYEILKGITEIK